MFQGIWERQHGQRFSPREHFREMGRHFRGGFGPGFDKDFFSEAWRMNRGHFRGGRTLEQGDLRYLVLHLIAERPRHGYDIIKAIEELSGGSYAPRPGVIYPTLTLLEEMGHATVSEPEGGRKQYAITDEGQRYLEANKRELEATLDRLGGAASDFRHGWNGKVMRATQNVARAVFMRPGRKAWTQEQATRVAEILDKAASEIEQL